jgi:2,4-dienoyl-CoA reductase-like NADH-dependent reductase (Old Yellow Enzyme family)
VKLAEILATRGVDFLDVSSGGNHAKEKIRAGPAYQAPFSEAVKKRLGNRLLVGCVGSITEGKQAEGLLRDGKADVVLVGRQFQRRPALVWDWADDLGVKIKAANQIEWGFVGRGSARGISHGSQSSSKL